MGYCIRRSHRIPGHLYYRSDTLDLGKDKGMLDTEKLLRLLALPSRRRILLLLTTGTFSVSELQQFLGKDQPYVSQQLANLRRAHVVECQRDGRACLYSLANDIRGAVLRGVLKLSSALQAADLGCTFVLTGMSRSDLLRAVRLVTTDIPCKTIDLVTYEPYLEPAEETSSPSVVVFGLQPRVDGATRSQQSLRCAHHVALDLTRQGVQVFKECNACIASKKHCADPSGSEDQSQRRDMAVALETMQRQHDE